VFFSEHTVGFRNCLHLEISFPCILLPDWHYAYMVFHSMELLWSEFCQIFFWLLVWSTLQWWRWLTCRHFDSADHVRCNITQVVAVIIRSWWIALSQSGRTQCVRQWPAHFLQRYFTKLDIEGSVLGPVLFLLCTANLLQLIRRLSYFIHTPMQIYRVDQKSKPQIFVHIFANYATLWNINFPKSL